MAESETIGRGKLLIYAGAGVLLLSAVLLGVTGDDGPNDRVEVREGVVAGKQFETLSQNGTETLEPLLSGQRSSVSVPVEEFETTFPELPSCEEMVQSDVYTIIYNDRSYLLTVEKSDGQTATPGPYDAGGSDEVAERVCDPESTASEDETRTATSSRNATTTDTSSGPTATVGTGNATATPTGTNTTGTPTQREDKAVSVVVTENTETVLLEYGALSSSDQQTIREASSSAGPINVSTTPQFTQASGISDTDLFGSTRLYYLSWEDEYYTVLTYEPTEFVDVPSTGQLAALAGIFVGFIALIIGAVIGVRS